MDTMLRNIGELFQSYKNQDPERIEKLPQSGSDRIYFRIYLQKETFIATFNLK